MVDASVGAGWVLGASVGIGFVIGASVVVGHFHPPSPAETSDTNRRDSFKQDNIFTVVDTCKFRSRCKGHSIIK